MDLSPSKPIAGLLAPLFALRTEADLGIGDTDSLRQLIDWAAATGFRLIQLLPINETGGDNSPYNAISSIAIDPCTLAISPRAIPGLAREDHEELLRGAQDAQSGSGSVDYPAVRKLKGALLRRAFDRFTAASSPKSAPLRDFQKFVKQESAWLDGYSLFRLLMEENGSETWTTWPEHHRTIAAADAWLQSLPGPRRAGLERNRDYFKYVQWIAFRQWRAVREYANKKGVALMGDVPYGISYFSADVFSQPENFDLAWGGGAPPEPYFKDDPFTQKWGQNWGVPAYRWEAMRRDHFSWWRRRVRMVREIFHLFRIDHILGFYRIYCFPWRPEQNADFLPLSHEEACARTGGHLPHFIPRDDSTHENAAANHREGEEYLKVLLEEVGEHRLIGEDLGAVPDYVRPSLASLGIAGFKIPIWEKRHDGSLLPGADYQRLSIATYATHDHEPLRALWERWARAIREHPHEDSGREALHEMRALARFAGIDPEMPQDWSDLIHEKLLRALFACNSWLAVCMITDLFAGVQRFNVPGSIGTSNWSERLPQTIRQWKRSKPIASKAALAAQLLAETGR